MKTLHPDTLAHYANTVTTLCPIWRVRRLDGQTYGFIDNTRNLVIDGLLYRASAGLMVSALEYTATFAVSTLDVTVFLDVSTEREIRAGIWEEASVDIAEVNYLAPPATWDPTRLVHLRRGYLGRIQRQNQRLTAEVRSLAQRLETRLGRHVTPTCPWRHAIWNGTNYVPQSECSANLSGRIHDGTVTALGADPHRQFTTSLTQLTGYFDAGIVAMTSGDNANLGRLSSMDIRRYEQGRMELRRPLPYPVDIGDTLRAVQGDDKTFSTCVAVYANGPNFGGFPWLPGQFAVLESPIVKPLLPPTPPPPDQNPANDPNVDEE